MFLTMLCKDISRFRALQGCTLSFVLLFFLSCTPATQNGQQLESSQLQAENSLMKKRLPLMERESDVLKKENQQHRIKIQDLEAQNKQLAMDLASLQQQYEIDMIVGEEQISSLEETIAKIARENKAAIDSLIADNKGLEEKMVKKSQVLHDQLAKQKAVAQQQREKLIKESGQRELDLTNKLSAEKEKSAVGEQKISSLKASVAEITGKLAKAKALAAQTAKVRDASQAELASIKATNATLNKKIAELTGELSRQKITDPTPTKP